MKRSFFVFLLLLLFTVGFVAAHERIHQRDIPSLLFEKGRITTSNRVPGMQQLQCTSNCHLAKVERVLCVNKGFDGNNVNWKCESTDLPANVKFGKMDVSCEGFAYSGDKNVLVGSCGLQYALASTGSSYSSYSYDSPSYNSMDDALLDLLCCLLVLVVLIWAFSYFPVVYEYPYYSYRYYWWNDPWMYQPRFYVGPSWGWGSGRRTNWGSGSGSWGGSSWGSGSGSGIKFGFASTSSR